MREICTILLLITVFGCNIPKRKKEVSTFNLKSDLADFSNKMTAEDTIVIHSNLWICQYIRFETDTVTKRNDSVFIKVFVELEDTTMYYEQRYYQKETSDSLNFEQFYSNLVSRDSSKSNSKHPMFKIIHLNTDTLYIWSYGLSDKLNIARELEIIKEKIYPDKDYNLPMVIPPPPPKSDEEILDSINKAINQKEIELIINSTN